MRIPTFFYRLVRPLNSTDLVLEIRIYMDTMGKCTPYAKLRSSRIGLTA